MNNNQKLGLLVAVVVIAVAVWWYMKKKKEGYANIGDLDNVGSVNNSYDIVDAPEEVVDNQHFADLIDLSTGGMPTSTRALAMGEQGNSAQRLDRIQGSELLPKTSKGVTPFNIDVADPLSHSFQVNVPRVMLKDPIRNRSDPFRGDIPITYSANVALVGKSRYGRDSLNLQGFFSPYQNALYNKYTGAAYKNTPMKVVAEETIMDY